jgi:hypothetical protein
MQRFRFHAALAAVTFAMLPLLLIQSHFAQGGGGQRGRGQRGAPLPDRPTPRTADGRVILGSVPGEEGLWNAVDNRLAIPDSPDVKGDRDTNANFPAGPGAFPKPKVSEIPFQPWARVLFAYRAHHEFEPYTRCKPAGGERMVATAYGTDFIDVPEQQRIYITQTGGPHSFRPIYMDGRPHPKDLDPSYYGHSVGHWEGDTLVIDTVGFNERGWIDLRGLPTTEQLHLTERISRPDFYTLRYEVTIDDPGAYTLPWTSGLFFRLVPGAEQFEFVCQDGNLTSILMTGEGNSHVDRTSRIVP